MGFQNFFQFIILPMEMGLIWLALLVGNAGIAIILFTIGVRLVLAPLQIVQLRNAKAMQRVQPMVAELRKKHGKDREALSRETMALYKEHQVNPAMGCLPTLLQFPILIGLFYALLHLGSSPSGYPSAIDWAKSSCNGHSVHTLAGWLHACYNIPTAPTNVRDVFNLFHAQFLWLSNGLGQPDPLYILPILAGITQWIQSRMMLTKSDDPQQQMMNTMTNFFPLLIVFFATRYPSGLSLYWVTSTLIGILIQYRVTGWGLLPTGGGSGGFRLPSLSSLFGDVQQPSRSKTANSKAKSTSTKKEQPAKALPVEEVQVDGEGGNGAKPANGAASAPRQRRRANRARGGRSGGRRG